MKNTSFKTSLEKMPFVSASWRQKLKNLDIFTVGDLLYHFPTRYDDFSTFKQIAELGISEIVTVRGRIIEIKNRRTWGKRRLSITEMYLSDDSGTIKVVWFNMVGPLKYAKKDSFIQISGKTSLSKNNELQFQHPNFELLSEKRMSLEEASASESFSTGSLLPIYPETKGITSFWLRKTIKRVLDIVKPDEFLPEALMEKCDFPLLEDALWGIHFPENTTESAIAKKRFAFEKMFLFQLKALSVKADWDKNKAPKIKFNEKLIKKFVSSLPFKLTNAQKKSAWQIVQDLEKTVPMNRLLEGDVGSGKTVVAAMAILSTISNNSQTTLLAPTEVLATQHYKELLNLFKDQNFQGALLTGSQSKKGSEKVSKKYLLEELKNGTIDFVVGTHAVLQDKVEFKKLALITIDEQHRFGVKQRARLQQGALNVHDGTKTTIPHLLTMTATPIPRTLSLALFGNLDLSIIDEYPKGRKEIKTKVVSSKSRQFVYRFVKQEIAKGRQVFMIYPLVEESSKISQVKAAKDELENLKKGPFANNKLGLLHGKIKPKDKEKIMQDFKDNKFEVLIATSVVEVGIDIPNASTIVIEGAERFGLAQLHQFRGRVGRSKKQSYCFLITSDNAPDSTKRLSTMERTNDGFKIATEDMKLRGPGQFMGVAQSGMPDIAMESLTDTKTIQLARTMAQELLEQDPTLKNSRSLKKRVDKIVTSTHWE